MLPLKRILCPTDLSANSRAGLQVAGEMAHYFAAELTVLHVHPVQQPVVWPYEGLGMNPYQSSLSREETLALRRKELAALAEETLPAGLDLKLELLEGEPAGMILETAQNIQADLIVIAPRGHGRLRKAIFGSTAEEIVRYSPCPVVTLHAGQAAAGQPEAVDREEAQARSD